MKKFLLRLWKEKIGQDTTEYALLLLLIALAAVTSMKTLATGIQNVYSTSGNDITNNLHGGGNGNANGGNANGGNANGGNANGGNFNGGNGNFNGGNFNGGNFNGGNFNGGNFNGGNFNGNF